jgi:hypothetical protein
MNGSLRCPECDEVIGVYEPLLVVHAGVARTSSLAREPLLGCAEELVMHAACGSRRGTSRTDGGSAPADGRSSPA